MTDVQQRSAAKKFADNWKGKGYEKGDTAPFWLSLLRDVFGMENPEQFVSFEDKVLMDKSNGFMDVMIPATKVLIEQKSLNIDLTKPIKQSDGSVLTPFQQAKRYIIDLPHSQHPRWVVTCNFGAFFVYDMERPHGEPEKINLSELPTEYHRLSFLIDQGNERIKREMEVSIAAGEIVGLLYDAFTKQYVDPTSERSLKSLNVLCVRLVFCLYADDAGIFGKKAMFHNYLAEFDAKHMRKALIEFFEVLDTTIDRRDPYLDENLAKFPFVNGGLFDEKDIEIPHFTDEIKTLLLTKASANFNWSEISPTIFGAVFESTLNPETRRSGGMHYTSIENIHKVIEPLFFNELQKEFEEICSVAVTKTKNIKLGTFQEKLASLSFFDPACGSGNFLTETYISLRRLENEVLKVIYGMQMMLGDDAHNPIKVSIGQFYGIEINDFAVTVARTALWIAESQMMKETEDIIHMKLDYLPLKSYVNIIHGNALRVDWESVAPKDKISYIIGNPPFVGKKEQTKEQKAELLDVFEKQRNIGNLDYVGAWYKKATTFSSGTKIRTAFVSTNSIAQGEQPASLWKSLVPLMKIDFVHRSFKWGSEATDKAAVHCVIIGFSPIAVTTEKAIYDKGVKTLASNINPYLVNAPNVFIESRSRVLCDAPQMVYGSMPIDDGALILSQDEYEQLLKEEPHSKELVRQYVGGFEMINNSVRYCLWLKDVSPNNIMKSAFAKERIKLCREFRESSGRPQTKTLSEIPHLFGEIRQPDGNMLVIPKVSSENRRYLPISFLTPDIIVNGSALIVPNATLYHFGVLASNVHNAWMRAVCGRMKSDYQYSAKIVYNNFPWPDATDTQKAEIEKLAQAVLDARLEYPDSTLADMYGETSILLHTSLLTAHRKLDAAVMKLYCFPVKDFSESDCVAALMELYQQIIKREVSSSGR